jgi:hypothetical protein
MAIDSTILALVADVYFDVISKAIQKLVNKSGLPKKDEKTSSIDERIAKIDDAKTSLLEGVRLIDELRETAQNNKKDAELALAQISKLESDKVSLQKDLDSIKKIAQSDIETFRKMAGVPSATDIRKERIIGFVGGVVSSLIASGLIWLGAVIIGQFFS